ncbi:MAG: NAD(P)H-dependent oxidoreductase subunit E [Verrucomicrobiales bacterium]|nr:NAD(P)H-dependent oxidoreductase subunit E [Verrucomicrobiales bacterium]
MSISLTPDFERQLDEAISHYPVSRRSAALPLLHLWQEHFGYISDEAVSYLAAKLELPPVRVLELVTFYPMFRRRPIGRHHVKVCRTLSCALGGSHELHTCLQQLTAADGDKYTVEFVECLANCGAGPTLMVNDDLYSNVRTAEQARDVLKKYQ